MFSKTSKRWAMVVDIQRKINLLLKELCIDDEPVLNFTPIMSIPTTDPNDKVKKVDDTVSCETCKCLILKSDAVKGKSVVKKRLIERPSEAYRISVVAVKQQNLTAYIHTPYYCLRCKPKGETNEKV